MISIGKSLTSKPKNKRITAITIGLAAVLVITGCLYTNLFRRAPFTAFNMRQDGSSQLVVNRMMQSREEGIFSNAGLMMYHKDTIDEWLTDYVNHEFRQEDYEIYSAQIGLQGIVASTLDKVLPLDDLQILEFLRFLDCLAMAIIFAGLMLWLWREFCLTAALLVFVVAVFSSWINWYAYNPYWVIWTMFLPFFAIGALHACEERFGRKTWNGWLFFGLAFLGVFIRAACGYEYISTVLVAAEIGVVYYAVKHKWGWRPFLKRAAWVGAGGLAGFFGAISINLLQRTVYFGSFRSAWAHLVGDVYKRTGLDFGASKHLYDLFGESLDASLPAVLNNYLEGKTLVFGATMGTFLVLLAFGAALYCVSDKISPTIVAQKHSLWGLLVATVVSLLAPLSWFVLAKAHSYYHVHINYLLWFVPTVFLIVGLVGALLQMLLQDMWRAHKQILWRGVAVVCCCALLGWPVYSDLQMWDYPENIALLEKVTTTGALLYNDGNNKVYHFEDTLYYMVPRRYSTDSQYFFQVDEPTGETKDKPEWVSFFYTEKELNIPFWKSYRVAEVSIPKGFGQVHIGQSRSNGDLQWSATVPLG